MKILTRDVILILALMVLAPFLSYAEKGDAYKSDLSSGEMGEWEGYSAKTVVVKDETSGKYVLMSTFTDESTDTWCNRGMRVKFKNAISWDKFNYIYFDYKIEGPARLLGVFLQDEDDNMWRLNMGRKIGKWALTLAKKEWVEFGWGPTPPGNKESKIKSMFIFIATQDVNTGAEYKLYVDNVTLGSDLPPVPEEEETEKDAEKEEAPPSDEDLAGTSEFPLQWKVDSIDANGNMVVDGKPFFPVGIMSCFGIDRSSATHPNSKYTGETTREINIARLKAIKDAGFNLLQTYTMQGYGNVFDESGKVVEGTTPEKLREGMIKFMDYCDEVGLTVTIGTRHPYCIMRPLPEGGARAGESARRNKEAKANMDAWKDHPALLAWYLIDEPGTVNMPPQDLVDTYRFIKSQDTVHPVLLIFNDPVNAVRYRRATDILAEDCYPIQNRTGNYTGISDKLDIVAKHQTGDPPLPHSWAVIQINQWVEGRRLPSMEEMRLMSLLTLTRDIKGLMFYEHYNYPQNDPAHWENISRAIRSLYSVIPAVLASDITGDYSVSNKKIHSMMRKVYDAGTGQTHYYLIAVNPAQDIVGEPVALGRVTFSGLKLEKGSVVTVLDEDKQGNLSLGKTRTIKLFKDGDKYGFVDKFGKVASHVYRIGPVK